MALSLATERDSDAVTARQRAMAYLDSIDASAPIDGFRPSSIGFSAFANSNDDDIRADAAAAALGAIIDRKGSRLASKYAADMANVNRLSAKSLAGRQNRSGLFGTLGKVGGTLIGGLFGGPVGAGIGGTLGGALGGGIG